MNDPVAKAKWVLETRSITGIPAESLGDVARQENIQYQLCDLPDDRWLDGMLLFKGKKRAIVVNTYFGKTGKHNFTFAHELGHYFLEHPPSYSKDGQSGFHCTSNDIESDIKQREIEANRFAAELLMPEDRFRFDMLGAEIDFSLITGLSNLYMVSKHACSNRILALTSSPCIIVRTKGKFFSGYTESTAARGYLKKLTTVPNDTAAYRAIDKKRGYNDFVECVADKWLSSNISGSKVYECTHIHAESGTAMTILKW